MYSVIKMNDFINFDFSVKTVNLACFVPDGLGVSVHEDRKDHGFALSLSDDTKTYFFDNHTSLSVPKGCLIYLPKGSSYVVNTKNSGNCYCINFDLFNNNYLAPFIWQTKNMRSFKIQFEAAEHAWRTKNYAYQEKCRSELYALLYELKKESRSEYIPKRKQRQLEPAILKIHKEYTEGKLHVPELAALCKMSESNFRKLFSSVYGTSPIKYINSLCLSRAADLLRSNMYSVKETMEMSGFTDEAYFSRIFKTYYGMSPKNYMLTY